MNDIACCNSHLLLPLSYSLLLLHLGSGFKRLSSSLAPRSNWPLPFICQPFDVVPAWAACYALPLTARSEVRRRLDFRTPTHLDTPHLLCRCVCLWYPSSPCPPLLASSLPLCPLLFYSLVLHSFRSGCGERQTFGFIAYTCQWLSPSAGRDKTAKGRWPIGASHLSSPHLELIAGGRGTGWPRTCASGVSICRDINRY